jgi:hypothetical protein
MGGDGLAQFVKVMSFAEINTCRHKTLAPSPTYAENSFIPISN